jgi:hypothetical protein
MLLFEFACLSVCPSRALSRDNVDSDAKLRNIARSANADRRARSTRGGSGANNDESARKMARKPAARVEFTFFDVIYEDGSQRSNRRVPSDVLGGLDGDAAARAVIEEQDRIIAEKSGTPAVAVKSIHRSGGR